MKKVLLPAALTALLLLAGCGLGDTFVLTFTIPAGNGDTVVYAEEELIVPQSNTLTVIPADDTPAGELRIESVYAKDGGSYDGAYPLTAGSPVKLRVERDGCFRLGVCVPNPTEEDITVTLTVKNVILIVGCS